MIYDADGSKVAGSDGKNPFGGRPFVQASHPQLHLNQNENFGPEYHRMLFPERGGFGNEIYTIRIGDKWLDSSLVSQTIQCWAGKTKPEAEDQGVYIVQSIAFMALKNVPAAVYKKMTGSCKGASPLKVREALEAWSGEMGVNADTHVTVLHLVKFK